jgi:hypothetical protein
MLNEMLRAFLSAFVFPGLTWIYLLIAVFLGLLFGAIWLACYQPPLKQRPLLLVLAMVSAR